ncbi:hypothetical protein KVH15_33350 [Streptomyces olivaceus]|uniref:hypothetical protein n=1 Tax=Streptomyces olivaceus TaxID=47716 RepID=UPI001CC961E0|nr:hypothetical protein [Streptomyces olivaceus]MBZ6085871.1 hypothetical protein [Streptomyces olivaceus]
MSVSARERIHAMLPILDNPVDADTREAQLDQLLAEAAAELNQIADTVEAQVAAYYGQASGIGPGSAQMVREAARTVRGLAGEKSSPTGADATPNNTDIARRAHLLADMARDGGHWPFGRVVAWYGATGYEGLGPRAARQDLAVLRDGGHIDQYFTARLDGDSTV